MNIMLPMAKIPAMRYDNIVGSFKAGVLPSKVTYDEDMKFKKFDR